MPKVTQMPRSKKPISQAKPNAKTPMTKVEFVLTLPTDMPAKQAAARAEAAGFTLTEQRVHAIRWAAKHKGKKGRAPAKAPSAAKAVSVEPKPSKAASPKANPAAAAKAAKPSKPVTKSAYILGFPPGTPAADVVAKAKADGIKLTIGHVYSTRTAAKAKAKKAKAPVAKLPVAAMQLGVPAVRATQETGSLEQQFVDLVLDMGSSKARALLGALRERVTQLKLG